MMTGAPPFRGRSIKEINQKIINGKLKLPSWLDNHAHSLLKGLLQKNAQKRLGAAKSTMFEIGGTRALKNHAFFQGLDWDALFAKRVEPPLPLVVASEDDTSYFDEEFTKMDVRRSISKMTDEELARKHSDNFDRFSFIHRDFTPPPPDRSSALLDPLDDIEEADAAVQKDGTCDTTRTEDDPGDGGDQTEGGAAPSVAAAVLESEHLSTTQAFVTEIGAGTAAAEAAGAAPPRDSSGTTTGESSENAASKQAAEREAPEQTRNRGSNYDPMLSASPAP
eukprot:scaffold8290_cov258-Pinguiococcus_pyrenoidosus.AAC.1